MSEFIRKAIILFVWILPLAFGPGTVEAFFWPVAKTVGVKVYRHDLGTLCLIQSVLKFRDLEPDVFAWIVASRDRPEIRFQVMPYDPNSEDHIPAGIVTRKSSEIQFTNRCFALSKKLGEPDMPIVIFAEIHYRTWHGRWTIPRFIGPYTISGLEVS